MVVAYCSGDRVMPVERVSLFLRKEQRYYAEKTDLWQLSIDKIYKSKNRPYIQEIVILGDNIKRVQLIMKD